MRVFLNFLWVLGVIYATIPAFWMAVHPFASYWRSRKRPFPFLGLIWVAIILVVIFATKPWHERRFYASLLAGIPAAILFACAILIYRRTGRSFGRDNLIGRTELEPQSREQKLVTTGIHSRARHPIYLGHLLMLASWTIGSGLEVLFALLVFAFVTGAIMVRMEDTELEARFGDEFREYKKRVPAIIPFTRL